MRKSVFRKSVGLLMALGLLFTTNGIFGQTSCTITCPADLTVSNDPGECGAFVNVPDPQLNGDCMSVCSNIQTVSTPTTAYNFDAGGDLINTPSTLSNAPMVTCGPGTGNSVIMTADFTGDHSLSSEEFNIQYPDGTTSGNINPATADDCDPQLATVNIPDTSWNNWVANYGPNLTFTLLADGSVSDICPDSEYQLSFQYGTATEPFTNDYTGSGNASADYPVGTTTVTYETQDSFGNTVSCQFTVTVTDTESPSFTNCPSGDVILNLDGGQCEAVYDYTLQAVDNCGNVMSINQIDNSGYTSGDQFPIGTTPQQWEAVDSAGNVTTCSFNVVVNEYPNPIRALACNDKVNISMDENCEAYVNADMILEGGPYGCYKDYMVEIATDEDFLNIIATSLPGEDGAYIDNAQVGDTFWARVTDTATGNNCWGQLHIEDKIIPELLCSSYEIPCTSPVEPGSTPFPLPDTATVSPPTGTGPFVVGNFDPCGDVTLTYEDEIITLGCDTIHSSVVFRDWTAIDESGNTTSCQDTIYVRRPTLDSLIFPPNYDGMDEPILACNGSWDDGCIPGFQGASADPAEGNNYPDPCETGLVNAQLCDNIYSTYSDQVIEACGETFKIIRRYTFLDWCTGETVDHEQLIKVGDEEPPSIDCPADETISVPADPNRNCLAFYDIPDITDQIVDDCSPESVSFTVTSSSGSIVTYLPSPSDLRVVGLPIGLHSLTYTATDGCGNTSSCVQLIRVIDAIQPVAVCDQNTKVSLGADGRARVYWQTIEDGSYDNCGIDRIELRRMNPTPNSCETGANDNWKEYIDFCCEDLNVDSVMIQFRVTDLSGNQNTCMVTVRVEEKLLPVVVAPDDITVSCLFQFNIEDLSDINDRTFGTVVDVTRGQTRDTSFIFAEEYERECLGRNFNPNVPTYTLLDGYVDDNCNIENIELFYDDGRDQCGRGFILRAFRAEDQSGNSMFDFQRITFVNCDPFTEDDIRWPRQYDGSPGNPILTCEDFAADSTSADPTPQGTGVPTFNDDDKCATVALRYEDEVFDVVPDACFKIFRHWEVLDWCTFDNDPSQPWTYTQVIKVKDTEAPILSNCNDVTICDTAAANCLGRVELVQEVQDCTPDEFLEARYIIEPFNDDNNPADDIRRNNLSVVDGQIEVFEMLPFGTHRITWIVEDMCGKVGTCEYLVTVEDCKLPTPYCLNGLATVIMPATGEITIWARDFDAGSFDNCGDVTFSFSSIPSDSSLTITCDDLDSLQSAVVVEIWVTDENGNQDYCTTYIDVQDPNDVCPGAGQTIISGTTNTNDDRKVADVEVRLTNNNNPTPLITTTDGAGTYSFIGTKGMNYEIRPKKNDDPLNGVSTWDIALIQQHVLGLREITDPYFLIAANVDDNQKISGSDIVDLRKLILGLSNSFSNNESWRFVDAKEQLPLGVLPRGYKEVIELTNIQSSLPDQDFVAVKIGDLNGNVEPNGITSNLSSDQRSQPLTLVIEDRAIEEGEIIRVPVQSSNFSNVIGYQMTVEYGEGSMNFIEVEPAALDVSTENIAEFEALGQLTMSWNDIQSRTVSDDQTLFTLVFKADKPVRLSNALKVNSSITAAEAYVNNERTNIALRFTESESNYALYQNVPNPFTERTTIGFTLPEHNKAKLVIYDVTGKVVKTIEDRFAKGYNQIVIDHLEMPGDGLYYYELISEDFRATKKMIFTK